MSFRPLVEGDCGGINPLVQLGGQLTRDVARKDEGVVQRHIEGGARLENPLVNEFLGQVAAPPQTFRVNNLLQEMRGINLNGNPEEQMQHMQNMQQAEQWTQEINQTIPAPIIPNQMMRMHPRMQDALEFFDGPSSSNSQALQRFPGPQAYLPLANALYQEQVDPFFDSEVDGVDTQAAITAPPPVMDSLNEWLDEFRATTEEKEQTAANFNDRFWKRLQEDWQQMSNDNDHSWLSEFNENLDPYKEYQFAEDNPMSDLENAYEKGKEYLAKHDIPSAVLCFEVAAKKEPERAEIWQILGTSQAENEMDPQAISALKRALELQSDNLQVLMALAVCYTNESLQNNAVRMLATWLSVHPKYKHLISDDSDMEFESDSLASSLVGPNKLKDLQAFYLEAVRQRAPEVDPDLQEALGVLFNLSGEYDKAVDCFSAALQVDPKNAKIWNRMGASLANGSRSVEAVDAYQQALELQPGFIRVRYNVGVCCMNLKAYKEAVEHLLTALTMQSHTRAAQELPNAAMAATATGQNQMSDSIWSTLKMVVSLMGRSDLQEYIADRNLTAMNEAFKD
ncbi:peroxisomal targeting signal 1 receptor [Drosophila bipectinata]|uniref:peroxisomal targeting signal 1 receptor n=1 Tax=Drosophila bipectinata TaxID=42026 RepID=UPI001C89C488|nr:peroxisomal targeting signal 1 receptor [Drosophila bipectinata]